MIRQLITFLIFTCACYHLQAQVNFITTIAGKDTAGFSGDGGPATNAELNNANQLCLDRFGNLYFTDDYNNRVRKIVLSTGIITTVAGNGTFGYSGDGTQATDAQIYVPDGVYADTSGNIYLSDPGNHRVRKVTIATGIITTIAGNGTPGNTGDGGQATNAEIYSPTGLYIDRQGNLYISDIDNSNIRKIAANGIITTIAGNGTMGYSGDGGPATNAQFSAPNKAIVDNYGNVIIADADNNVLREIPAESNIIVTIAGNGTPGYSGDGGLAMDALLNGPTGIYIDKQNNIFFAEYGNGTIRKIDGVTKIITTFAGCGIMGYAGDGGPATDAKLIPEDLAIDKNGTMYIADYENNRIRMVYNPKLGTTNIVPENGVVIYPNPGSDELHIDNAAGSEVIIYNLLGQEMLSSKITSDKKPVNIQLLIPGIYIVHIITPNGEIQNIRLVKQ